MSKISIICLCADDNSGNDFKKRNAGINVECLTSNGSNDSLINRIILNHEQDYCLITHDDVFFPRDFTLILESLIERINVDWPEWGLAGNGGISAFKFGPDSSNVVKMYATPYSGPNVRNVDLPCSLVHINTILVNTKLLREKLAPSCSLTPSEPHNIALSIKTLKAGCSIIVVPELTCFISSEEKTDEVLQQDIGYISEHDYSSNKLTALSNATIKRERRTLDIVIRTQFRNKYLLDRAIMSANNFKDKCKFLLNICITVISDQEKPNRYILHGVDRFSFFQIEGGGDTRYKIILEYINKSEAEFSWFIDDDDWIIPESVEILSMIINAAPENSLIFCDTQQYHETLESNNGQLEVSDNRVKGRKYEASLWPLSLGHENFTPFAGMIFSKHCLSILQKKTGSQHIMYLEDHYMLKNAILSGCTFPIIHDILSVGISLRKPDDADLANTVTETDRTKWYISAAQKYWVLNNSHDGNPIYPRPQNKENKSSIFKKYKKDFRIRKQKSLYLILGIIKIMSMPHMYVKNFCGIRKSLQDSGAKGVREYIRNVINKSSEKI